MSAEFPVDVVIRAPGAKEAAADVDQLFEVIRNGKAASAEALEYTRNLSREYREKTRALRMLSTEFRVAHPNLMLFTRGLSAVASAARVGMSIINSLMLILMATSRRSDDVEQAQRRVAIATKNLADAIRLHTEDSKEAKDAMAALADAQYDLEKAARAAKKEMDDQNKLILSIAAVSLPQLAVAGVNVIANWKELTLAAGVVNAALAGIGLTGIGIVAGVVAVAVGIGVAIGAAVKFRTEMGKWPTTMEESLKIFEGWPPIIKEALAFMTTGVGQIGEKIEGLPKEIETAAAILTVGLGKIKDVIIKTLSDWGKPVTDAFKGAFEYVLNIRANLAGAISDLGEFLGDLKTKIIAGAAPIVKVFTDIGGGIKTAITTALTAVEGTIRGSLNVLIGYINTLIDGINSIRITIPPIVVLGVTLHPGFTWGGMGLPRVPTLAEGAIVTKPTLAVIGERGPEAVIPLGGGGMGGRGERSVYIGEINIYVPTTREYAQDISRHLVLELNRYIRWA